MTSADEKSNSHDIEKALPQDQDRQFQEKSSPAPESSATAGENGAASEGSGKEHIEQLNEVPAEPPLNKRTKLKRHLRRWWWAYAIGQVIFLAIILPCLFLEILPAGIQSYVNSQNVPITRIDLRNPKPEEITWSLQAWLKVLPAITVKMRTVKLNLVNTVAADPKRTFTQLTMTGRKLRGNALLSLYNEPAPIMYNDGFWNLFTHVLMDEYVYMSFRSNPTVQLSQIKPYHVSFNKDIKTKGFNQFKGATIHDPQLLVTPESDGTNFLTKLMLPNPSPVSLDIGNVTYYLHSENLRLGTAKMENFQLQRGNATYPVRSQLNLTTLIDNLPTIMSQQAPSLRKGYLQLNATGIGTGGGVVHGGKNIDYYANALTHLSLPANVPVVDLVNNTMTGFKNGDNNVTTLMNQLRPALQNSNLQGLVQNGPLGGLTIGNTNLSSLLGNLQSGNLGSVISGLSPLLQNTNLSDLTSLMGGQGGQNGGLGQLAGLLGGGSGS